VHASSSVGAADNSSGREDADVKAGDFLIRHLPVITEEESLPRSDLIKSIVSAIARICTGFLSASLGALVTLQ
jgi:hypothetical protein